MGLSLSRLFVRADILIRGLIFGREGLKCMSQTLVVLVEALTPNGKDHRGRHVLSEPFQTTPHSLSTLSLHETTLVSLVAHQSVHMNGLRLADSVATIDGLQVDERVEVVIRNDYHVCSGQSVPMP